MKHNSHFFFVILSISVAFPALLAQQRLPEQKDEVIRIATDLVQTDVTVLDKQGRFVAGLQAEQFELLVDEKPKAISFFEQVRAGSQREATLMTASGAARLEAEKGRALSEAGPSARGRTVFFFVDDMHLSPDSMRRTRQTLQKFVNDTMGSNDQVAITTASGQLGFLQQLTNDKTVLGMAIERLKPRSHDVTDMQNPPMTHYQAYAIEQGHTDVKEGFVEATCVDVLKLPPRACSGSAMTNNAVLDENNARSDRRGGSTGGGSLRTSPSAAGTNQARWRSENLVKSRARVITRQAAQVILGTLSSLESLVRRAASVPERKLLIFVSEGFFINFVSSTQVYDLRRLTDAATRTGTVIYTVDARGLTSGLTDATKSGMFEPSGRLARTNLSELRAAQQPLYNLAAETGGHAWLNSNDVDAGIARAIDETSNYYLLGWRPETVAQTKDEFRRIKVAIKGRSDLTVRVRPGFFTENPDKASTAAGAELRSVDDQLLDALRSSYPIRAVPITLSAGYLERPQEGLVLAASAQIERTLVQDDSTTPSELDAIGAVVDTTGNIVSSFKQKVTIPPGKDNHPGSVVVTLQFPKLTPGLHQVRFAARDSKTGRIGSASQWVEIPKVAEGSFSLSSIFLSEQSDANWVIRPDRRFATTSKLRFQTYVYNAARSAAAPKIVLQMELRRDGQTVIQTPSSPIATDGVTDLARIPIAGEFPLSGFPAGQYELKLTVTDLSAKTVASRQAAFVIR